MNHDFVIMGYAYGCPECWPRLNKPTDCMTESVARYDHATADSRAECIRELETMLHAILQRYHPNGCEIPQITLDAREPARFMVSENLQRRTLIISSLKVK